MILYVGVKIIILLIFLYIVCSLVFIKVNIVREIYFESKLYYSFVMK